MATKRKPPVLAVLKKARALVARGWCQGAAARARNNRRVATDHAGASRFCAWGALARAAGPKEHGMREATYLLCAILKVNGLSDFNDAKGRTKAEVLAAFDRAIKLAGRRK